MKYIISVNYAGDTMETFTEESELSVPAMLEQVFAWFNHGSSQECDILLQHRMRSLSVNDFVGINGEWYQCQSMGWKKVDEDYMDVIESAVVNHRNFSEIGAWGALNEVMYILKKNS